MYRTTIIIVYKLYRFLLFLNYPLSYYSRSRYLCESFPFFFIPNRLEANVSKLVYQRARFHMYTLLIRYIIIVKCRNTHLRWFLCQIFHLHAFITRGNNRVKQNLCAHLSNLTALSAGYKSRSGYS